jgi:hypothetical protein
MKKFFKKFLFVLPILFLFFVGFLFFWHPKTPEKIEWGVVFSQKQCEYLNLDWKKVYLEILDDLKVKNIKLISHWDLIEPKEEEFNFEDLDWQIKEAEKRGVKIILVIGMKTGRWPECHIPAWGREFLISNDKFLNEKFLDYIDILVERYKNSKAILAWQIENEPFFPFGVCPKIEKNTVKKEFDLVKSLDSRPTIFVDSGEYSFWIQAAKLADIVGTTLHRKVYSDQFKIYLSLPFPSSYYFFKKLFINKFFKKEVILAELQAEPWCKTPFLLECSEKEQKITMNLEQFKKNIEFAKRAGFAKIYFWGVEWWYQKKTKNQPQFWEKAKEVFKEN